MYERELEPTSIITLVKGDYIFEEHLELII